MSIRTRSVKQLRDECAPREEVVQSHIMSALKSIGLRVLQTTHRVKRVTCPECRNQFVPKEAARYGATPGVPDLLVTADDYPPGTLIGLEVKGAKTPLSAEQKELHRAGRIHVVRSIEDAEKAIEESERYLLP